MNWILKHLKNLKRQTLIFLQNASIKLLRRPQACSWAKFTGTLFSGAAAFSARGGAAGRRGKLGAAGGFSLAGTKRDRFQMDEIKAAREAKENMMLLRLKNFLQRKRRKVNRRKQ